MNLVDRDSFVLGVFQAQSIFLEVLLGPVLVVLILHLRIDGDDIGFDVLFSRVVSDIGHPGLQVHRRAPTTDTERYQQQTHQLRQGPRMRVNTFWQHRCGSGVRRWHILIQISNGLAFPWERDSGMVPRRTGAGMIWQF